VIYYQAINYSLRRYSDPCEAMYIMQGLRDQSLFEHHLSETAKIGPPKPQGKPGTIVFGVQQVCIIFGIHRGVKCYDIGQVDEETAC
jgi:hypothetical protein